MFLKELVLIRRNVIISDAHELHQQSGFLTFATLHHVRKHCGSRTRPEGARILVDSSTPPLRVRSVLVRQRNTWTLFVSQNVVLLLFQNFFGRANLCVLRSLFQHRQDRILRTFGYFDL